MRLFPASLLLAAAALSTAAASAESFTYNVNDHFAGFSVVGTLTTNLNQGTLSSANIIDWGLTLADGTQSLFIDPSNSGEAVFGNGLTATSSALYFRFGGSVGNQFLLQNPYVMSTVNYLCYQDKAGGCDDNGPAHESIQLGSDLREVEARSGNAIIATAATPEPGSLALVGTGLCGALGFARRRFSI